MPGLFGSVVWRAISEGMLVANDIKRFRGKKRVLVALAPDRTHPEMEKFTRLYGPLKEKLEAIDTVIFVEDHPRGPVHDRLKCADGEFKFALIGFHGQTEMEAPFTLLPEHLRDNLGQAAPLIH
jgi:hypothetical protein